MLGHTGDVCSSCCDSVRLSQVALVPSIDPIAGRCVAHRHGHGHGHGEHFLGRGLAQVVKGGGERATVDGRYGLGPGTQVAFACSGIRRLGPSPFDGIMISFYMVVLVATIAYPAIGARGVLKFVVSGYFSGWES